jgi:hypothetical protein
MVAHTCSLNYLGSKHPEDYSLRMVCAKSLQDPHLNQWLGSMASTCHPCYLGKHKQDHGPGWPGGKVRPYLKNNPYKKAWWSGSSDRAPA